MDLRSQHHQESDRAFCPSPEAHKNAGRSVGSKGCTHEETRTLSGRAGGHSCYSLEKPGCMSAHVLNDFNKAELRSQGPESLADKSS